MDFSGIIPAALRARNAVPASRAQTSVEIVIIAAVMLFVLLAVAVINDSLNMTWLVEKERLEASSAASQVALAINRASAGGNGTAIAFENSVGADIVSMSIYDKRSVRAYYELGDFVSVPLVTNRTDITSIPINQPLVVRNREGVITIEAG